MYIKGVDFGPETPMSFFSPRNRAEASDRLAGMTGWAAALASVVYALKVLEVYAGDELAAYLNGAQLICIALLLLVFLPAFFIVKRGFGGSLMNPLKEDGFIGLAMQRAGLTTFVATFLLLNVLTALDRLVLDHMAAEVLVDLLMAFGTASFALSFFVFSRDSDAGDAV